MNVVAAVGVVAVFWGAAAFLAYLALSGLGVHETAGRVMVVGSPKWRRYRSYCRMSPDERKLWRRSRVRAAAPVQRDGLGRWVGVHAAA